MPTGKYTTENRVANLNAYTLENALMSVSKVSILISLKALNPTVPRPSDHSYYYNSNPNVYLFPPPSG